MGVVAALASTEGLPLTQRCKRDFPCMLELEDGQDVVCVHVANIVIGLTMLPS